MQSLQIEKDVYYPSSLLCAGLIFLATGTGSNQSPLFVLFYSLEEIFEMAGIVLFIYGLTSYISSEMKGLRIVFE